MLYPSINEIRKKADSRYTLVILAAKRARDLVDGKPSLLDTEVDDERAVSIAANEIADDLITYRRVDPAQLAQEQAEAEAAAAKAMEEAAAEEELEEVHLDDDAAEEADAEAEESEDAEEAEEPVDEPAEAPAEENLEEA